LAENRLKKMIFCGKKRKCAGRVPILCRVIASYVVDYQ